MANPREMPPKKMSHPNFGTQQPCTTPGRRTLLLLLGAASFSATTTAVLLRNCDEIVAATIHKKTLHARICCWMMTGIGRGSSRCCVMAKVLRNCWRIENGWDHGVFGGVAVKLQVHPMLRRGLQLFGLCACSATTLAAKFLSSHLSTPTVVMLSRVAAGSGHQRYRSIYLCCS